MTTLRPLIPYPLGFRCHTVIFPRQYWSKPTFQSVMSGVYMTHKKTAKPLVRIGEMTV